MNAIGGADAVIEARVLSSNLEFYTFCARSPFLQKFCVYS